jgi:uncharacterized membrane protein
MKILKKNMTNKIILVIGIAGMILCIYIWNLQLALKATSSLDLIVPCTPSGNCANILHGSYSDMFGVPFGVWGFFYYSILTLLAFQREFIKDKILTIFVGGWIAWGAIFSLYLRYIEFAKIGSICALCWISVGLILTAAGVFFYEYKKKSQIDNL